MELLLAAPGREYEWAGNRWRKRPYGFYAVEIANALLVEEVNEADLCRELGLGEMQEKEAVSRVMAAVYILLELAAGDKHRWVEELTSFIGPGADPKKRLAELIVPYLSGQNKTLWQVWENLKPWPFLAKGNKLGWYVNVTNKLEAAAAEVTIAYVNRWRPPIRVCKVHERLYYGKKCPLCEGVKAERKSFLNLLRVHKCRYPYFAVEIARFSNEAAALKRGQRLNGVMRKYLAFCREHGLPTAWAKNYRINPVEQGSRAFGHDESFTTLPQ